MPYRNAPLAPFKYPKQTLPDGVAKTIVYFLNSLKELDHFNGFIEQLKTNYQMQMGHESSSEYIETTKASDEQRQKIASLKDEIVFLRERHPIAAALYFNKKGKKVEDDSTTTFAEYENLLDQCNAAIIEERIEPEKSNRDSQTSLRLQDIGVTRLPSCLLEDAKYQDFWTNLLELYLDNNRINSLPLAIEKLTALRHLSIDKNHLEHLPETIGNLTSLETLNVSNNKLQSLPLTIGNLRALKGLHLANNKLQSLPLTIGNLTSLRILQLPFNELQGLPWTIVNLICLTFLNVSDNQIENLPLTLGNLSRLEYLYLCNNQLRDLPESLGYLTVLRDLDLRFNVLQTLPESLGNLIALTTLNLGDNQLQYLPATIGNLKKVDILTLDNNCLQTLPETIGDFKELAFLSIHNNQLKALPQSIDEKVLRNSKTGESLTKEEVLRTQRAPVLIFSSSATLSKIKSATDEIIEKKDCPHP